MQHATTVGAAIGSRRTGSLRAATLALALAGVAVVGGGTAALVASSGGSLPGDAQQSAHPVRGWNAPALRVPVNPHSAPVAPIRGRAVKLP
jgi:hypothetical protein